MTDPEDSLIEDYVARRICDELNALQNERDALARENEAMRRCAIKYLGWLGVTHMPLDEALREDMSDPTMCGDAPSPRQRRGRRMTDLIERLRAVKWEVTDDCDRMPDDPTHKCVFVDMRPGDFRALLREAADTMEAARDDADVRGLGLMDYGRSAVVYTYSEEIDGDDLDAAIDEAREKGVADA